MSRKAGLIAVTLVSVGVGGGFGAAVAGPPPALPGEVVLRTDDAWVRWLALDADTLFFVRTDKVRRGDTLLTGDALYGLTLAGSAGRSLRQVVPSDLPDERAWAKIEQSEERHEKLGGTPRDHGGTEAWDSDISWPQASEGHLFWIREGALMEIQLPQGPITKLASSVDEYDVVAGDALWLKKRTLMRWSRTGGRAEPVMREVRGLIALGGSDQIGIARAEGDRTVLVAYNVRTGARRTIGSVPFAAIPRAADDGHVYLDAGGRLVSFSIATGTSMDVGEAPPRPRRTRRAVPPIAAVVQVGPFVLWQLSDSRAVWRRRIDGSDRPTIIAKTFRIEVVCGEAVMQGEPDGRISALAVGDGTQKTIATSPEPGEVRYLFRAPHHLYWQTKGTIYRAPFECPGGNPFPQRGTPPRADP